MAQLPLNTTFLVSVWLEAVLYGFEFSVFCAAVYVNYGQLRRKDVHGRVMFVFGAIMFFLSTWHLAINLFRLIQGFIVRGGTPDGPIVYYADLPDWSHVMKDTIYATQEILGNAAAIFRCWIVWNKDFRIVALPSALLTSMIVSGYTVCALFTKVGSTVSVFNGRLNRWIEAFYSGAVVSNVITTGLIAWRLWQAERKAENFRMTRSGALFPVLRIMVESAAMQLFVEIILLALYVRDVNAQYILLESVTPIVSITFNVISVRLRYRTGVAHAKYGPSSLSGDTLPVQNRAVHTIGSMPMRRLDVNVETAVEEYADSPYLKPTEYQPAEFTKSVG